MAAADGAAHGLRAQHPGRLPHRHPGAPVHALTSSWVGWVGWVGCGLKTRFQIGTSCVTRTFREMSFTCC